MGHGALRKTAGRLQRVASRKKLEVRGRKSEIRRLKMENSETGRRPEKRERETAKLSVGGWRLEVGGKRQRTEDRRQMANDECEMGNELDCGGILLSSVFFDLTQFNFHGLLFSQQKEDHSHHQDQNHYQGEYNYVSKKVSHVKTWAKGSRQMGIEHREKISNCGLRIANFFPCILFLPAVGCMLPAEY